MNSINEPTLNPEKLLNLYLSRQYDQLSEQLITILEHFEQKTYYQLDTAAQYFINVFVKNFLYLFTQPDYLLSDPYVTRFIQLNLTIANVVAMSGFKTTDAALEILRDQPNNFAKLLTLYSARNTVKFDYKAIFNANPTLACLWYSYFFEIYRSSLVNPIAYQNLQEHIHYRDEQLTDFYKIDDLIFGCTYINPEKDRDIKQKINQSIQKSSFCQTARIKNTPNPQKIAIITALWYSRHSVYRILSEFVESLKEDYELTLVHLGNIREDLEIGCFKKIKSVSFQNGVLNLDAIRDNDFMVAYYPDIGMSPESIFLSNLRLAPIQVCGLGHSVSTFGAEIDYFISGAAVELPEAAERNYSERLVLLPGAGAIHNRPDYAIQHLPKSRSELIINCSWFAQKVNYPFVSHLKEILQASPKAILLRFFSGGALLWKNDFIPFAQDLAAILGKDQVELVAAKSYEDYMTLMEEGDICIESYHFGGCNTVADSLYLRKPTVTLEGTKWYNRIGSQMLRDAGLSELVTNNVEDYCRLILRLIQDDTYRREIQEKIKQVDLDPTIFGTESKIYFKKAIDFLITNHETLQRETSRKPIQIKPI